MKKINNFFISALIISILLITTIIAISANEIDEVETVNTTETVTVQTSTTSSDELLLGYMAAQTQAANAQTSHRVLAREFLNVYQQTIYDILKENILKVATGESTDTTFTLNNIAALSWTSEDLGGCVLAQNGNVSQAAQDAIAERIETTDIFNALLNDLEYELFWFDKTNGMYSSYSVGGSSLKLSITHMTFKFYVAADFSATGTRGTLTTSLSKMECIETAITNASAVVSANASKDDYDKLLAYKTWICDNVDYCHNYSSYNYGHPWQLIYVFDNDPTTKVVCEGYAKAYKYLCDSSTFDLPINCYLASGDLYVDGHNNGGHMWNVVYINGKYYLADITNSDSGSSGQSGELFLAGATPSTYGGSSYTVQAGNSILSFSYYNYSRVINPETHQEEDIYTTTIGNYISDGVFFPISSTSYLQDALNQYTLTVQNGSGSGTYSTGTSITVVANTAPAGSVFDHWEAIGITLADNKTPTITITLPKGNVTLIAVYHTHTYSIENYDDTHHWMECTCGAEDVHHPHSFNSEWHYNSSGHWKSCKCGKEDTHTSHSYDSAWKSSSGEHWKNCKCGKEGTHTSHSYNSEWKHDANSHWKNCECGKSGSLESHTYNSVWKYDDEGHWKTCKCSRNSDSVPHTYNSEWHNDNDGHWKNCQCGKEDTHVSHEYDSDWQATATEHWKNCECSKEGEHTPHDYTHSYDSNTDGHWGVCECSKKDTLTEHSFGTELAHDGDNHYYECACGEKDGITPHSFSNEWSKGDSEHWHECTCGAISDKAQHSYTKVTTKQATETEEGVNTFTCGTCQRSYTEPIPPLSQSDDQTNDAEPTESGSETTASSDTAASSESNTETPATEQKAPQGAVAGCGATVACASLIIPIILGCGIALKKKDE